MKIDLEFSTWSKLAKKRVNIPLCAENGYIRLRRGKVVKTRTLLCGSICGDFDKKGRLIGIEIIGVNEPMVLPNGKRAWWEA